MSATKYIAHIILLAVVVHSQPLSYDPEDYLEVYPNPLDPQVLEGRTPLYFALIQSLGGEYSQFDASGSLAGVKVALDRINNDSSLLPGYTLHYAVANSQCNRTVSLDALHSQLLHEPKKVAIIGSGCSVATEAAAEVSHYYNITQISCASGSPALSNRIRFRRYFQLQSNAELIAIGFYELIVVHGWRKVSLIVQDESLFTVIVRRLKKLLDKDRNAEYSETVFSSDDSTTDLENPFNEETRIVGLFMYSSHALQLLCDAYHTITRLPYRYVLLTMGWYSRFWWKEEQPGLTCTAEERESVLLHTLAVTDEVFIDESQANLTITPGITSGEFLAQEQTFLGVPPLNITFFPTYSQYCHDATWTLAYALNKTLNSLSDSEVNEKIAQAYRIPSHFELEDFTYENDALLEIIFRHLSNTSFRGFTGEVSFDDQGTRKLYNLTVFQYRHVTNATDGSIFLDIVTIGNVFEGTTVAYVAGEGITTLWNGSIPYDGVANKKIVTVHPAVSCIYLTLGSLGIMFAIVCLIFNFIYRNTKLVKLASTKLNYLIGIGAIILYLDTFFFVIPTTDPAVVRAFCNLTPWLTALGYSLCYGTILAKMARVFYIFRNPSTKKKKIKDRYLVFGVTFLVAIDVVIIIIYMLVEGVQSNLVTQQVTSREKPMKIEGKDGIITEFCIYVCDSTARDVFLGVLYGYKMLLQIIALILAFSIRKVKVKGLDDAKYIGATIYVTSIVLAVIIVATYSLRDIVNGFAALFCTGFIIGTTVILVLVFLPLMFGLYADPKGEDIFKRSNATNSATKATYNENEMMNLRKRIVELEKEVKESQELVTAFRKENGPLTTKSGSILRALEDSHMVERDTDIAETITRSIWDSPTEEVEDKNE